VVKLIDADGLEKRVLLTDVTLILYTVFAIRPVNVYVSLDPGTVIGIHTSDVDTLYSILDPVTMLLVITHEIWALISSTLVTTRSVGAIRGSSGISATLRIDPIFIDVEVLKLPLVPLRPPEATAVMIFCALIFSIYALEDVSLLRMAF
jgi:hypothetical protein